MIWNWLKRRYINSMHAEDLTKVNQKIEELRTEKPGTWEAVDGFNAITGLDLSGPVPSFLGTSGYPIKVFVHLESGEVRIFSAYPFFVQGS